MKRRRAQGTVSREEYDKQRSEQKRFNLEAIARLEKRRLEHPGHCRTAEAQRTCSAQICKGNYPLTWCVSLSSGEAGVVFSQKRDVWMVAEIGNNSANVLHRVFLRQRKKLLC